MNYCDHTYNARALSKISQSMFLTKTIDTFTIGLRRADIVEEMGRIKPKTVAELMYIANRFADSEHACHYKRTRSPKDDGVNRYTN
jgi:hypothetical protein